MNGIPRWSRALGLAALFAVTRATAGASPVGAEGETGAAECRFATALEVTAGTDGGAAAYFVAPRGSRFSAGLRAGLGYEWADFRWDDPSAALAFRWRLLSSSRWAWWLGAETGLARIDTGYDRFLLPFAGATTGGSFRFAKRLAFFLEAAGRYGGRHRESEANLDFLGARYEETYFIDPLLVRLGFALNL